MIPYYQCEFCKTTYSTAELAQACEDQKIETVCEVGDIVTCYPCFGWYDGDKDWVANLDTINQGCSSPGSNCFSTCCNYLFYWVVTAITFRENRSPFNDRYTQLYTHDPVYHLASRAIKGKQKSKGYIMGWTTVQGHHTPEVVEKRPKLKTSDLIGLTTGRLL